jgi:hypothetical protein
MIRTMLVTGTGFVTVVKLRLTCERCGTSWDQGGSRSELRDTAKSLAGWRCIRRYGATRDYCGECAVTARRGVHHARSRSADRGS